MIKMFLNGTMFMLIPLFFLLRFLNCTMYEYAVFMGTAAVAWNMRSWLIDWWDLDVKAAQKDGVKVEKEVPKQYTNAAKRRLTLSHWAIFTVLPTVIKTLGLDLPRKIEVFWNALFYERSILALLWLATAIGTMVMSHVLLSKFLWGKVFKFSSPTKELSALSILGLVLGEIGLMWLNRVVAQGLFEFWDGMENFAGIVQILVLAFLSSLIVVALKKLWELTQTKSSGWRHKIKGEAEELYKQLPTETQDSIRNAKKWLNRPWKWLKNHRSILLKVLLGVLLALLVFFFRSSLFNMMLEVIINVSVNLVYVLSFEEDVWLVVFLLLSTATGVSAHILRARMNKIYKIVHWSVFVLSTTIWNFGAGAAFQRAFLESLLCTVLSGVECWGIGYLITKFINRMGKLIKLVLRHLPTKNTVDGDYDDDDYDDDYDDDDDDDDEDDDDDDDEDESLDFSAFGNW